MQSLDNQQLLNILALSKHPVAIYTSSQLIIESANQAMLKLWNKDESVSGKSLKIAVSELAGEPFMLKLEEVWLSGKSQEAKAVPVRTQTNGEWHYSYYDLDHQVIKNEAGEVYAILQTAQSSIWLSPYSTHETEGERMKRFFMQAPAGICVLDGPDFVFEMVNPQYQQFFPGRDLLGLPLFEALPEIKGGPIEEILNKVYKTGQSFEGKELLVPLAYTSEGEVTDRYFNFMYQPRRSAEGIIDGILVFVIEVTETVLNRKKIEESELSLRSLVMSSPYGLMILKGSDFVIEIVNQEIANLWEKKISELSGKKLLQVLPEIEDQPFPSLLKQVYTTGIPYGQEEEVLLLETPEGPLQRYVSFHYHPLKDAEGKVSGIIVACENITEKVESRHQLQSSYEEQQALNEELASTNEELATINEEMEATNEELIGTNEELGKAQQKLRATINDLEESENKVRAMVESAPFPIGVYEGREMRIVLANKAIMDVYGKGYDVLGKRYAELLPELENQGVLDKLDAVYTTGIPFHARNQRVDLRVDGELREFYFNYSFTPLFNTSGEIYGVMNTGSNVTDLVLAKKEIEQNEAELLHIKKQLEAELEAGKEIQRQKDSFIGIASHELKTPLTSLSAIIQVASRKLKDSNDSFLSGAMDKAGLQVKRMHSMITGFLNISRLESGKMHIEKQAFDIEELIKEVIDEIAITTSSHRLSFSGCGSQMVNADRDKMNSVVSNLLTNAIKYSPQGKEIAVRLEKRPRHLQISVQDHGMGIQPEDQKRVFNRYFRVEAEQTSHISGFGIGLYLSAEIVRGHGGDIWVESEPEKGSKFCFTLPL